ncbi:MAG: zinc-dependent peptidase [Xanthomonadales bacterium]|nr:zinc-dependent peptidase [Xanthomonadales bacterium]
MFGKFKRWRKQQITQGEPINNALWARTLARAPVLESLSHEESERLRQRTILFLHEKSFTGAAGMVLDRPMQLHMSALACLLILNLNIDYYAGWHEVIVYPGAFVTGRPRVDENGLVHSGDQSLGGEAWGRGPLILSWENARPGAHIHGEGSNVVIHEFAHKLDMLNGANANGMPPLHSSMKRQQWTDTLAAAYKKLKRQLKQGRQPWIDPYAATNPAEFFAVISEHFFERPLWFKRQESELYQQLAQFYRQDPAARFSA